MALTKVSGPLLHGSNDNLGNYVINNITGVAATFTGNISVGGTLTYDDVTSVESVGLITAKSGIHVTGGNVGIGTDNPGAKLDVFGNTKLRNDVDIDGNLGSSGNINIADGKAYKIGNTSVLDSNTLGSSVFHSFLTSLGSLNSLTVNGNSDLNGTVNLSGATTVNADLQVSGAFDVNGNSTLSGTLVVTGNTEFSTNFSVGGISTFSGNVGIGTTNPYTTGAASKHKLTVAADDVLGIGRANTDMFYVRREYDAGKYTFQTINGGNTGNFNFQPFGGVVGIGTKTPDTKLHVTTSSSSAIPLTLQRTHNNNVVVHYENPTLSMYAGLAGEGLGWAVGDGADLGNTTNNQLMVTSAGRIGIGTIAPETNLTIAKNATNQTVGTIPTVRLTNLDTTAVASDIVGSYEFFSKDAHSLNKVTGFMRNTPTDAGVNYDLTFGTIKTSDSNAVERLRINSDGRLLISRNGLTASKNVGTKTGEIQVAAGGNNAAITLIGFSNDIPGPYLMLGKTRAGNASGNTIVQENDRLGEIAFCGADGNDINSFGAAIKSWVDGTPGNNDMPGRLAFYTTESGQSSVERMVIRKDGKIGIGITNPSQTLTVQGTILKSRSDSGVGLIYLANDGSQNGYISVNQNAGVTRIKLNSSGDSYFNGGNVGIGITNPSTLLQLVGSTASVESSGGTLGIRQKGDSESDGITLTSSHANSARFYKDSDGSLHIYNTGGDVDDFVLTNVGKIGIGLTDPSARLEVSRGAEGTYLKVGGDNASNGRALTFTSSTGDTGSNGALHTISAISGNGAIALDTGGTERLLVNNVGHTRIRRTVGLDLDNLPVGLNTATNYTLHISNNTNANSKSNGICFGLSSGDGIGAAIVHTRTGSNSYGPLMFATKPNGGDMTERLTIESDGNVTVKGGELGISTFTTNTSVLTFKNNVKDHKIGGVTVNLADDTISPDIQVPGARHGCILFIFAHSDATGTYPQPGPVGMVYVDVGQSANIRPMFTQSGVGSDATTNVGQLLVGKNSHETDINNCDNGKLTIMKGSANGRLKLANRLGDPYHFYLTMM